MILYDKNFEPLGVSQDILNFLGYEDMDDFKTYATDIADLFIKKSGYVYKYEDFSWINYILHSGSPNKSALVRLKNGKKKEINLAIKELFLFQNDENGPYYEVDIIRNKNSSFQDVKHGHIEPIITIEEDVLARDFSKQSKHKKKKTTEEIFKKPSSNFSQNRSQNNDGFIEDISDENLSFLKSLELPK